MSVNELRKNLLNFLGVYLFRIFHSYEEPGGVESKLNEFFLDMRLDCPYKQRVLNGTKRKYTNHRSSIVFVLPPQANATIRIGFMPVDNKLTTTRLYLR